MSHDTFQNNFNVLATYKYDEEIKFFGALNETSVFRRTRAIHREAIFSKSELSL